MKQAMPPDRWKARWSTALGEMHGTLEPSGWIELRFPAEDRIQIPDGPSGNVELRSIDKIANGVERSHEPAMNEQLEAMRSFLSDLFSGQPPRRLPAAGPVGRTAFERAVYRETHLLQFGATATYGTLAIRAGRPGGARAVGGAMGRNSLPLVIPCHRVLASGRRGAKLIGGFSSGLPLKRWLLALEGIDLETPEFPSKNGSRSAKGQLILNI